jgi:hypothetical protein
LTPCTL